METRSVKDDYNFLGGEKNEWYIALKSYRKCLETFVINNNDIAEMQEKLKEPYIDKMCIRELGKLRELAPTIGYKEVFGQVEDETYYRK